MEPTATYADMGAELRLLLAAHPEGMVVGEIQTEYPQQGYQANQDHAVV